MGSPHLSAISCAVEYLSVGCGTRSIRISSTYSDFLVIATTSAAVSTQMVWVRNAPCLHVGARRIFVRANTTTPLLLLCILGFIQSILWERGRKSWLAFSGSARALTASYSLPQELIRHCWARLEQTYKALPHRVSCAVIMACASLLMSCRGVLLLTTLKPTCRCQ